MFRILFLAAVISAPLYLGAVHLWSFSLSAALLSTGFLSYSIKKKNTDGVLRLETSLDIWIIIYSVVFILSAFQSQIPTRSIIEGYKLAVVILAFYATVHFCRDRRHIRMLGVAILSLGALLSFAGLLQYLGALPNGYWHSQNFLSSVYVNHNHFAGLLELLFPVALGFSIAEREHAKKVLFIFLTTLMGLAFIFTLSRGAYISMTVGVSVMIYFLTKDKKRVGALAGILAIGLVVLAAAFLFGLGPVSERIRTLAQVFSSDLSSTHRLLIWKGAIAVIEKYPIFGSGPGTFEFIFLSFRPEGLLERPVFAHNDFLNLLADCGIAAFIAAALLLWAFFRSGIRIIYQDNSRLRLAVGAGCLASLTSFSIHGATDFNFHIPANWLWCSVVAGLLFSFDEKPSPPRGFSGRMVKNTFSFIALAVLTSALVFGASDFFRWRGERRPLDDANNLVLSDFNNSLKFNPWNSGVFYLRGVAKEKAGDSEGAIEDFKKAIKLNPYEPYYDYHLGKSLLYLDRHAEALEAMRSAVIKDALDVKISYLTANSILDGRSKLEPLSETWAVDRLKKVVSQKSPYQDHAYEALWNFFGKPTTLEEFVKVVSSDLDGALWFFERTDQWKYYRSYYLRSNGIDAERKYKLMGETDWDGVADTIYSLKDFSMPTKYRIADGECIYANGLLEKKVEIKQGRARLILKAKGNRVGQSYPILLVKIDGKPVDCLYVDSPSFVNFYSILELDSGAHSLGLEYINDRVMGSDSADRNVCIQSIAIEYPKS